MGWARLTFQHPAQLVGYLAGHHPPRPAEGISHQGVGQRRGKLASLRREVAVHEHEGTPGAVALQGPDGVDQVLETSLVGLLRHVLGGIIGGRIIGSADPSTPRCQRGPCARSAPQKGR
jgi:hypothetical protein